MQRKQRGELAYYTSDSLEYTGEVTHAISTRHGGVSPPPFHTLNLSACVGDTAVNSQMNQSLLFKALGLYACAGVDAGQAQGDQIAIVGTADRGTQIQNVDALITHSPDLPLLLQYADCVPVFLYDPKRRAIGVVHAGWRGTVAKIAAKAVQAMCDAFGTEIKDVRACIGPSIGPCCYQVGNEVIAQIRAAYHRTDDLLLQHDGSIHLDLWQANTRQLHQCGVEQVEVAQLCTSHHTEDFYSWRAEKRCTGRFGALIALVE